MRMRGRVVSIVRASFFVCCLCATSVASGSANAQEAALDEPVAVEQSVSSEAADAEVRGKSMLIAGVIVTGAGTINVVLATLLGAGVIGGCSNESSAGSSAQSFSEQSSIDLAGGRRTHAVSDSIVRANGGGGSSCGSDTAAGVLGIAGLVMIGGGIPLIVIGAKQLPTETSAVPEVRVGLTSTSVTWRF